MAGIFVHRRLPRYERKFQSPGWVVSSVRFSMGKAIGERRRKRNRKWLALGLAGSASGLAMLFLFKSIPVASGSAAVTILTMIALKHLALFVAVSSPAIALFQSIKPRLRAWCGRPPED